MRAVNLALTRPLREHNIWTKPVRGCCEGRVLNALYTGVEFTIWIKIETLEFTICRIKIETVEFTVCSIKIETLEFTICRIKIETVEFTVCSIKIETLEFTLCRIIIWNAVCFMNYNWNCWSIYLLWRQTLDINIAIIINFIFVVN